MERVEMHFSQAPEPEPVIHVVPVADVDEQSTAEALAPQPEVLSPEGDGLMTKDEFFVMFCGAHAGAGVALALAYGVKVQALAKAREVGGAREASDALYDSAYDLPWMRWLITKNGKWLQRVFAIGMYGYALRGAIVAEFDAAAKTEGEKASAA